MLADYQGPVDEGFMTRAQCYRELDALEVFDHSLIYDWPEWRARARRMLGARAARASRTLARAMESK